MIVLSDLDLPKPAFQALLIPVVEIERSSKLLSSSPSFYSACLTDSIACLANSTMAQSSCLPARWIFAPFFLHSSLYFSASCCRVRQCSELCKLFFPWMRQKNGLSLLLFRFPQRSFFLPLECSFLPFFWKSLVSSKLGLLMRIPDVCR